MNVDKRKRTKKNEKKTLQNKPHPVHKSLKKNKHELSKRKI